VTRVSFGVQPVGMKKAVMMPHAMNAAMLGMIMPLKKVPKAWTWTLAPFLVVVSDVVVIRVNLSRGWSAR
jgi:hypothetical protein